MTHRRTIIGGLAALVFLFSLTSPADPQRRGGRRGSRLTIFPSKSCQSGTEIPGEVLVRFVDSVRRTDALRLADKLSRAQRKISARQISADLNIYMFHGTGITAKRLLDDFKSAEFSEKVMIVEPNLVLCLEASSYDQWALRDYNGVTPGISAVSAWKLTHGSKEVVVGVIDSGIDATHPDLRPNLWSAPAGFAFNCNGKLYRCQNGWNALEHDCNTDDQGWHGTHVSGIIGAKGNNGIGIDGVNWDVSLMALKAFDFSGHGDVASVIEAIDYAIQARRYGVNVRILNNSYGQRCDSNRQTCPSSDLEMAIRLADKAGLLFVASAGETDGPQHNNDDYPHYPSSYNVDNIVAVAWTNRRDELSPDANYGHFSVDLGAPGSEIWSTLPLDYHAGGYRFFNGASMATPFVSGAAALVLSRCPGLSTAQLKNVLLNTVDAVPSLKDKTVTGGRLNAYEAVKRCG